MIIYINSYTHLNQKPHWVLRHVASFFLLYTYTYTIFWQADLKKGEPKTSILSWIVYSTYSQNVCVFGGWGVHFSIQLSIMLI